MAAQGNNAKEAFALEVRKVNMRKQALLTADLWPPIGYPDLVVAHGCLIGFPLVSEMFGIPVFEQRRPKRPWQEPTLFG